MKKNLVTIILLLLTLFNQGIAQEEQKSKVSPYLSIGLSISNSYDTTFSYSSYPSLEFGLMKNNFSLGLVVGRSNLSGFDRDTLTNYWYELKSALSFSVEKFSVYGLLGLGNYISTSRFFIEFGAGFSYSFNRLGIYSQVSNWDGVWYVTPGLSYTF